MTVSTSQIYVRQVLAEVGAVWIRIVEYRDTHGYMHVMLSKDGRTALVDLYFRDCLRVDGVLSGGPWTCTLLEETFGEDRCLVLRSAGLSVHALAVAVERGAGH